MIELRPATAEDIAALAPHLPYRIRAIAATRDGKVIGIGGLVFRPDGVWAAVVLTDEARGCKLAMHRAALMTMRMARDLGLREVFAAAEPGRPGAQKWLARLGFVPEGDVFVWRRDCGTTATAPKD